MGEAKGEAPVKWRARGSRPAELIAAFGFPLLALLAFLLFYVLGCSFSQPHLSSRAAPLAGAWSRTSIWRQNLAFRDGSRNVR